ncbi:OPT oligopeptide transporter protein-domain-containing protein [Limtongia smithiae]|uniref:OPT oligopeptide transporter protein-domain-containing protein n=1 Tax=Limtongia smithiae TaxID=1125753 RepID=UPI0034CEBFB6
MGDTDEIINEKSAKQLGSIEVTSTPTDADSIKEKIYNRLDEKEAARGFGATKSDVSKVMDKILEISMEEAMEIVDYAMDFHQHDSNFPRPLMRRLELLKQGPDAYGSDFETYEYDLKTEACLIGYYSPYAEVRAVTNLEDDPNETCESFRQYLVGSIWTIVGTGVNTFFYPRFPNIQLSAAVVQVFIYPSGKICEWVLPKKVFHIGKYSFTLNPGPWTYKEQVLSTMMVAVTIAGAYFTQYNLLVQKLPRYYDNDYVGAGYQFLMCFSSQFFGLGMAGVMRRFVIYPVKQMWPTTLPTLALNRALVTHTEHEGSINGWTISRYRLFIFAFCGMTIYYWLPGYLFEALSYFNWMTWIKPDNFNLAVITGSDLGLGLNPFPTFDWNVANNIYSNVVSVPFFSYCQQYIGAVIGFFIITALYYSNTYYTGYMDVNYNGALDNTNAAYNVSRILVDQVLDEQLYQSYSPPYYSAGYILVYGTSWLLIPLSFLYPILEEWHTMWDACKNFVKAIRHPRTRLPIHKYDTFMRMMSVYKEVPDWWYVSITVISFVLAAVALTVYPTNTPVWSLVIVALADAVCLPPLGIIQGVSGYQIGIWMLPEIIAGYLFPGNGIANLILKMYGANIGTQADTYASNQKVSHYARIPPRATFRAQNIATIWQVLVALGIVNWQLSNIKNLCDTDNVEKFTCEWVTMIFTDTVMYGVMGPRIVFNYLYPVFKWGFLFGFVLTLVWFGATKLYPKLRIINPNAFFFGMSYFTPWNLCYWTAGFYVNFFFNYFLRTRYLAWWQKYAYVLSSALSAGLVLSAVIIFFAVEYNPKDVTWWGNDVSFNGVDGGVGRQTLYELPERGYFGWEKGKFPT